MQVRRSELGLRYGRTPHWSGLRGKSSGSLEFLLLGLLSACIGVLLFLFFSQP